MIITSTDQLRISLFNKHHQDLLYPIIECFKLHQTIASNLMIELVRAADRLLELDIKYPCEGNQKGVVETFSENDGFEALEAMEQSSNTNLQ